MQTSRLLSYSPNSPSFDSFSSAVDLAGVAARVVEELRDQEFHFHCNDDDDDDNFEFPSRMCSHPIATADEIFQNGKIRPLNPYRGKRGESPQRHRPALRKLMSEERDTTEEEDLTGVSPETYCVWTPKQSKCGGVTRDDDDYLQEPLSKAVGETKRQSFVPFTKDIMGILKNVNGLSRHLRPF